jgi:hypothetical protein
MGPLASMPFLDGYWKHLLSFAFRLSLIPVSFIWHLGGRTGRGMSAAKNVWLLSIAPLMLSSVLIVIPPKQPMPRVASSGIELEAQPVKEGLQSGKIERQTIGQKTASK